MTCLLAFAAGCSEAGTELPPDASAEASRAGLSDAVYLDVTKRGVDIGRQEFDLIVETVCERDLPSPQAQPDDWNREADTIAELGGVDSFLDARLLVRSIDQNVCN
ncbi:hypothetical protein [Aeromicrobium sp. 179-A 4D2 NHS]|uniref:hypothetical protein n=1 Tax=Aeromicrobium sp. 179-A 4D2 NHS TaxID=3142375 RepID=UPI00399FDC03